MPPKSTKRTKKKTKSRYQRRYPIVPQFRDLAPDSMMLRDSYQTQIKLIPLGSIAGQSGLPHVIMFKCASGYDVYKPVSSGRESFTQVSGTTGTLHSLLTTASAYRRSYSHYYVLGSKMTVSLQSTANIQTNPEENNIVVACGVTRDSAWPTAGLASGTAIGDVQRARNSTSRQLIGNSNYGRVGNRAKIWASYSPKSALGITDTTDCDELKVSVVDGDPSEETYFYVYINGLNTATALDPTQISNQLLTVKIDYMLKFVEPIQNHNESLNPMK